MISKTSASYMINADHGVFGFRHCGLFLDAHDAAAVELRHAEALRVGDFLQKYLRAAALMAISAHGRAYVALDDIIAEHDADRLARGEMLDQRKRVGDAAFAFLISVIEVLEAERLPLPSSFKKSPAEFPPVTIMMSVMPALTSV